MTEKRKKNPTEPFEEELQETEENEQEQIEDNAKPRRNRRRGAKQRKTEAGEVVVPKYLWVKYGNAQPVEVSTAGCNNVSKLIKAVKEEMKPDLDSFSLSRITLHTSEDAAALEPDHEVVKLASGPAGLSAKTPLIVKTIPAGKITLTWNTSDIKPLNYEPQNPLFELDTNYLVGAGLPATSKLVLYCRSQFHEQFKFLQ
ncbi:hypothetical protein MP638_003363, partial [Amoeboaphelidium occidentale]